MIIDGIFASNYRTLANDCDAQLAKYLRAIYEYVVSVSDLVLFHFNGKHNCLILSRLCRAEGMMGGVEVGI